MLAVRRAVAQGYISRTASDAQICPSPPPSCADGRARFSKGAYTLGKMVWGKGWEELLAMLEAQRDRGEKLPQIAAFGSGEAEEAVRPSVPMLKAGNVLYSYDVLTLTLIITQI